LEKLKLTSQYVILLLLLPEEAGFLDANDAFSQFSNSNSNSIQGQFQELKVMG
jgi:hypothetical protein